MGFLKSIKQALQAGQQMADGTTTISATITNPSITIGSTVQGEVTISSLRPCTVSNLLITLLRDKETLDSQDEEQWIFNKEIIPVNTPIQAGETKVIPFNFIVNDGLDDGLNLVSRSDRSNIVIGGVDPAVLPKIENHYNHKLTIMARLDNSEFGPYTGVAINFEYPTLNVSL